MSRMAKHGEIKEKINIYCNDVVYEAIGGWPVTYFPLY